MADPGLPTCNPKEKNISGEIKTAFKGTFSVISSKYGNPRFTTVPSIPLSDQ